MLLRWRLFDSCGDTETEVTTISFLGDENFIEVVTVLLSW